MIIMNNELLPNEVHKYPGFSVNQQRKETKLKKKIPEKKV